VRVFYYAAAGAALSTGIFYFLVDRFVTKNKKIVYIALWSVTIFFTIFGSFKQAARVDAQSYDQQRILIQIIEQFPYLKPDTTIVLLTESIGAEPFELTTRFTAALRWTNKTYNENEVRGLICYENLKNCTFGSKGIDVLARVYFTTPLVPRYTSYKDAIVFRYSDDKNALLLGQIPLQSLQPGAIADEYQPYERIKDYVPFPARPQHAFDFTPNPNRIHPPGWIAPDQTLDDRQVCNAAHSGKCSLFFYTGRSQASFEQKIETGGMPGDYLEVALWAKAGQAVNEVIPIATITVFYNDGSTSEFKISSQLTRKWALKTISYESKKAYTHLLISLHPNIQSSAIWLDDLYLSKNKQEIAITNPSFEK